MAASIPSSIIVPVKRKMLTGVADLLGQRKAERSLLAYIRDAWNVLEPTIPFLLNWHHELIAEYLEAVTAGEIKRLLINVAPRYTKSRMVSVFWPTWNWARRPEDKFGPDDILTGPGSRWIFASYADELSTEHSRDRRTVMESPWYQSRWRDRVSFSKDQNRKTNYQNRNRGAMFAVSMAGAAGLGAGGNCLPAETTIETENGKMRLGDLVGMERRPRVLSYNHRTEQCEYRQIIATRTTTTRELVSISTRNGRTLSCTPAQGVYSGGEYRYAESLKAGDDLLAVRTMRLAFHGAAIRNNEAAPANFNAFVLRPHLRGLSVYSETRAVLRSLWNHYAQEGSEREGFHVVCGMPAFSASGSPGAGPECSVPELSTMWSAVSAPSLSRAVLFESVCGPGSFRADGRDGEFELQRRLGRHEVVRSYATAHLGTRQGSLCELRGTQWRDHEVRVSHSSYRQGSNEQYTRESGCTLSTVPREAPQVERIDVARRLCGDSIDVHDLQVEGNSNFFANEILVHNCIVIDDPHDTKGAESEANRTAAIETFRSTLSTRHNDKKRGSIVIIMQRLNELDLAGYVMELGGWEHLRIEGELEERRVYSFPRSHQSLVRVPEVSENKETGELAIPAHTDRFDTDGSLTKRIEDGGLLWPAREGPKEIAERKLNLGSIGFAAQYQQRPAPKGGALFKHEWWKYWRTLPRLHRLIEVWDTAYEEGDNNSYSNCDVWGFADVGFVLVDNWHGRVQFPELQRTAVWMAAKWNPEAILIEARASGRSLIQELKRPPIVGSNEPVLHASIPIVPIEPEVDKYTRAVAVTPIPEAGLVWLPDPSMPATPQNPGGYAWVDDYQKELELFPAGKLNDRVDTLVHGLTYLRGQGSIVDFWRRLQHHQDAVDAAQEAEAHGRKAPAVVDNPVMTAYKRAQEMWREKHNQER